MVSTLNAALLIAGTTVGGGFLALLTVLVAPSGFVPSATALVGVCDKMYYLTLRNHARGRCFVSYTIRKLHKLWENDVISK
jgi:Tryptophan/tyrosine permease family